MKRPLGDYVAELRQKRKITLRELAPEIGISMVYFSEIESGIKIPSPEYMEKIASYFDVSLEELNVLARQQRFFCVEKTSDQRIEAARSIIALSDSDFKAVKKVIDSRLKKGGYGDN